ncbi:hypothetical protein THTE_3761 [Thermogutta terrifontis]|uniref:Uncharacterized protein n=1 Tax=Thermogutta terrifontis TaxID=1331910 RepID=A0A286RKA4_9BACT|nr:hypothetical protein THTE_3761 [Thermogutta terrifontis]
MWVPDDGEDYIRSFSNLLGAVGPACPGHEQPLSFLTSAVEYRAGITCLQQMTAHRRPHHPGANPTNSGSGGICGWNSHLGHPPFWCSLSELSNHSGPTR